MSESLLQTQPKSDGSNKSLDNNGDLTPGLIKVWDANEHLGNAAELEQYRDSLNKQVTATALHKRAMQVPEQLSF
jgi:hypothetical protein